MQEAKNSHGIRPSVLGWSVMLLFMILNEDNHNHHNQENIGYLHSCMSGPGVIRSSANIDLGPKNANLKFSIWAYVHFESVETCTFRNTKVLQC